MARDYKSRSKRSADNSGTSAIVWLFTGILIGLIIAGVFYLKNQKTRALRLPSTIIQQHDTQKPSAKPPAAPANPKALQTQFDFYQVLSSKKNTTPPAPVLQQTKPIPVPAAVQYIVQIAALSHFKEADQLKAQLLLLGFEVHVSPLIQKGQTLQRVWIGPFAHKSGAVSIQQQLKQNQITSTVLKSGT